MITASRILRASVCALSLAGLAACATVTRGTHQAWTVETEPNGASIQTTNGLHCDSTPCTFRMERRSEFDVTITKPGYRTVTSHVTNVVSGNGGVAMAGNVIVGGVIGGAVDIASGAMLDIRPNPLHVVLEADDGSTPAPVAAAA